MKKFVNMVKLNPNEHHTFWMQKDFDYNGSTSKKSVYEVIDALSIDDKRKHKENIEEMQQQLLSLALTDGLDGVINNDDHDINDMHVVNDQSYEVEGILGHRDSPRGTLYKVKWKGYNNRYNSWLTSDMFNDPSIIEEYLISQ
jgi:hypothetical protein